MPYFDIEDIYDRDISDHRLLTCHRTVLSRLSLWRPRLTIVFQLFDIPFSNIIKHTHKS